MKAFDTYLARSLAIPFVFLTTACVGFVGHNSKSEDDLTPFSLLAGLTGSSTMPLPATNASTMPEVEMPSGDLPSNIIQVVESKTVELPMRIDGTFVPVGKVYDVGPDLQGQEIPGNLYLPSGMAELTYEYDPDELKSAGFIEEFAGFYYDKQEDKWLPVDRIEVNTTAHVVKIYTTHFTPFVLTAVPAASGGIADPPACIAEDFPSGISGSAGAVFTIVDTEFKYYKDRAYTINRTGGDFDALGFNGALGISVCNGNSPCGSYAQHKQFTGSNYIQFTAHTNIDLYLMYDTRGGATLNDDSKDTPWIQAAGFVNTGNFVETTDAVGKYRVYMKSYNKGDLVSLDGNRKGVTAGGIDTNYWIVIKRQGIQASEPAAKMCEAKPSLTPLLKVSNARIAPGANQMSLGFQIPDHEDFAGVVIRRSTTAAPSRIGDGIEPTGTVISPTGYKDQSLAANTTYYYTIFALDKNGTTGPGVSVSAKTGPDGDGDGLSNTFETSYVYPTGQKTDAALLDTDGDGTSDGIEFLNGTNPRLADTQKPNISQFQLTSQTPTTNPVAKFTLNGNDNTGIVGWQVTLTDTPPVSWSNDWTPAKPSMYTFALSGTHNLFAWAVDAAGNVSSLYPAQALNLEGINAPRYLMFTTGSVGGEDRRIDTYSIDLANADMSLASSVALSNDNAGLNNGELKGTILLHPNGRWLYHLAPMPGVVRQYTIQPDGSLQLTSVTPVGTSISNSCGGAISPTGKTLVLSIEDLGLGTVLRTFAIDSTGAISPAGLLSMAMSTSYQSFLPNGILVATVARTDLGSGTFLVNETSGTISQVFNAGDFTTATLADPLGRYMYSKYIRSNTIQIRTVSAVDGSASHVGQVSFGGHNLLEADPTGQFIYAGSTTAIRVLRADPSLATVADVTAGLSSYIPARMMIDPTGTLAFVAGLNGTNSQMAFIIYRMAPDGGMNLVRQLPERADLIANRPVIVSSHDGNDPPVAHAGLNRWVEIGKSAALHGHGTFDPDAVRCGADSSKYVAAWSFLTRPAGSNLGDSDIIGANTLGSARFVPDVSGDYVLRLSFKDDPGSCQGSAKSSSATVTIHAGVIHTTAVDALDTLPPGPGFEPRFQHNGTAQEDWGGDMMWAVTLKGDPVQYLICLAMRNYANSVCNNPTSWLNPWAAAAACAIRNSMNCESQFDIVYSVLCMSPELNQPDAQNFCEVVAQGRPTVLINGTHVRVDLNRGHFWIHNRHRTHYRGHYVWWDYN